MPEGERPPQCLHFSRSSLDSTSEESLVPTEADSTG